MKRIALQIGFYGVLVFLLTQWMGMASQEVLAQSDVKVPYLEDWKTSGHADAASESFVHWNEEKEKVVPVACAACHSTTGHLDFIGADGSEAGKVDQPAPIGTTVECVACHNDVTAKMTSVKMPSGIELKGIGDEVSCMICHQGRASKAAVDAALEKLEIKEADVVNDKLGFVNVHYYAAAATKYGTLAKGGYEYAGKTYEANFAHVAGYETCDDCHNPHTLKVKLTECATCHQGVASADDLKKIRMAGSLVDFDGDGDVKEGIYFEIEGLQTLLYQAIQKYAAEKSGKPIGYESHTHPYFFIDPNADGKIDEAEMIADNRYNAWTARLLKAAYNYQVSMKDPGAYAHGGKYVLQLLRDSIEDLNAAISAPIELKTAQRNDAGHFDGSSESFRHWDAEGVVAAGCTKCHTAAGLPMFFKENTNISMPPSNGLECVTCHNDPVKYTLPEVKKVTFPSGSTVETEDVKSNLCLNCHQGRESTTSVNKLVKGLEEDVVSDKLRFLNVHYFAAGATKFGTEAKGGYEYEGKQYAGQYKHVPNFAGCTTCHDAHALGVKEETCGTCHPMAKTQGIQAIRMIAPDYDGDGDKKESVAAELAALNEALYAAIQAYAKNTAKVELAYDSHSYPYFFNDTNGNGKVDPDEAKRENGFNSWTPKLLKAAYNYQYAAKDPGGYAHNGKYIAQLLQDSLESFGAKKETMVRPK